ncbi:tetratricopeptide repeat protein [Uliginosibacterium sp. H3]|uniref:Ancillary SecYEG translocon subunit n=1 Tax=Uliginosibacterium silvisoli TaxID=3114758 RepID=A0ABU6K4U9_9RHOO|nr:tetratricopeptide repeat protein [Uliginosibacterium sp. H3]
MAVYDLEEQEQLSAMKAWWDKYGNAITWVAIVAAGALLAWVAWSGYQRSQNDKATALYSEVFLAAQAGDTAKLQQTANQLTTEYPSHLQASLGALLAAKADIDKKDEKSARVKLTWVIEHTKEATVKDLARLRLATLLLDEKAYDEALKQLESGVTQELAARFAEMRGDVLVEQNKLDAAKQAYKQALEKFSGAADNNTLKTIVQTKLDALGAN